VPRPSEALSPENIPGYSFDQSSRRPCIEKVAVAVSMTMERAATLSRSITIHGINSETAKAKYLDDAPGRKNTERRVIVPTAKRSLEEISLERGRIFDANIGIANMEKSNTPRKE